jgi:hypothetical protein
MVAHVLVEKAGRRARAAPARPETVEVAAAMAMLLFCVCK